MPETIINAAFYAAAAGCAGIIAYAAWDLRRAILRREAIRRRLDEICGRS